jgi:FHA domain/FhaA, N-terminal domain
MVGDYAKQQRYTFMGPVKVSLEEAEDLDTGLYRVRSRTLASSESQPHAAAARQQHTAWAAGTAGQRQGAYGSFPPKPTSPPPMPPSPPGIPRPGAGQASVSRLPGAADSSATRRWVEINGTRHQISRPTMVLGRSTEADVRIDDPGVSRRHCEIRAGSPSVIADLGSTNGIVVDGQHTARATLRDGSRIVVGSTTIVYRQTEG